MRHKSKNKIRPLFTLSLEMTRLVNETRLLLVPGVNSDIYGRSIKRVLSQGRRKEIHCGEAQYRGVKIHVYPPLPKQYNFSSL